jgi:hypothetical protein
MSVSITPKHCWEGLQYPLGHFPKVLQYPIGAAQRATWLYFPLRASAGVFMFLRLQFEDKREKLNKKSQSKHTNFKQT